jgi:hypothetical protein
LGHKQTLRISKMNLNQPTQLLGWEVVEPIFKDYLSVWSNHIPMNWAIWSWQCLHKAGLTVFNNDDEELTVRGNAVALSLIYYEYCWRSAFHELSEFSPWDETIIKTLKSDFLIDIKEAKDTIFRVKNCLITQSDELEVNAELWINCAEASQGFVFGIGEKARLYKKLVQDLYEDFNFDNGKSFIFGNGIDDISTYISISGLKKPK